jgi:hypothetical protein
MIVAYWLHSSLLVHHFLSRTPFIPEGTHRTPGYWTLDISPFILHPSGFLPPSNLPTTLLQTITSLSSNNEFSIHDATSPSNPGSIASLTSVCLSFHNTSLCATQPGVIVLHKIERHRLFSFSKQLRFKERGVGSYVFIYQHLSIQRSPTYSRCYSRPGIPRPL